jgi:hypothetical protein
MLTIMLITVELKHRFVQDIAVLKADGLALQPLQMRAKVQVLSLNVLPPLLPDPVLRPRN